MSTPQDWEPLPHSLATLYVMGHDDALRDRIEAALVMIAVEVAGEGEPARDDPQRLQKLNRRAAALQVLADPSLAAPSTQWAVSAAAPNIFTDYRQGGPDAVEDADLLDAVRTVWNSLAGA